MRQRAKRRPGGVGLEPAVLTHKAAEPGDLSEVAAEGEIAVVDHDPRREQKENPEYAGRTTGDGAGRRIDQGRNQVVEDGGHQQSQTLPGVVAHKGVPSRVRGEEQYGRQHPWQDDLTYVSEPGQQPLRVLGHRWSDRS